LPDKEKGTQGTPVSEFTELPAIVTIGAGLTLAPAELSDCGACIYSAVVPGCTAGASDALWGFALVDRLLHRGSEAILAGAAQAMLERQGSEGSCPSALAGTRCCYVDNLAHGAARYPLLVKEDPEYQGRSPT
jgi:hypothetical protein